MKTALSLALVLLSTLVFGQGGPDQMAVRKIIHDQVSAWNKGDAEAYSRHFAADRTFTNIVGMFLRDMKRFGKDMTKSSRACSVERPSKRTLSQSGSCARMLPLWEHSKP